MSKINFINSDDHTELYKNYDIKKNVTDPILNKFDYAKCLGQRATEIAMNAPVLIEVTSDLDTPEKIAEEELRQRKTPYIIEKKVGNDKYEYWKLEDMTIQSI